MIRVERPAKPTGFPGAKIQAEEAKIQGLIAAGTAPESEHFAAHWKDSKAAFREAQHKKCAYCESCFTAAYAGDVEHKRPKAEVQEPAPGQQGNRDDLSGKPPGRSWAPAVSPGYWWLAYRWENWVFSCSKCNGWKLCRFPLVGPPQTAATMLPGREASETPLLLDPHDPVIEQQTHFGWSECGQITGLTQQGASTIDVCGLDRTSLEKERSRISGQFMRALEDASRAIGESDVWWHRMLVSLLEFCRPEAPYAAMCRGLLEAKFIKYEELLGLQKQGKIPQD